MDHAQAFEVPGTCANEYDVGAKECAESFERFIAIQRGHGTGATEMRGFDLSYGATGYENHDMVFFSDRDSQIMNFAIKLPTLTFTQEEPILSTISNGPSKLLPNGNGLPLRT